MVQIGCTDTSLPHAGSLEVLVGQTLDDIGRIGLPPCRIGLADASELNRIEFFFSDLIDEQVSSFGSLFNDPSFLRVRSQPVSATKLQELVLLGGDGVVLNGGKAVYDTLFDVAPWQKHSLVASFQPGKSLILKGQLSIGRRLNNGIYLLGFNGSWQNYAHWLQQMLPWLVAFVQLKREIPDLRLIMPNMEMSSFHRQTLRILGIQESDLALICADEVVVVPVAFLISRIDLWSVPFFLRTAANVLNDRVPAMGVRYTKIYIHRSTDARRLANFSEIEPLVVAHGFAVVEFEEMPLERQIALMKNAEYVIGEHGAGLINILFCPENAQVLELFNPTCVQPEFWSVASVCGLGYGFLVGEHSPTEARPMPDWNSEYYIRPEKFERAIQALLLARTKTDSGIFQDTMSADSLAI